MESTENEILSKNFEGHRNDILAVIEKMGQSRKMEQSQHEDILEKKDKQISELESDCTAWKTRCSSLEEEKLKLLDEIKSLKETKNTIMCLLQPEIYEPDANFRQEQDRSRVPSLSEINSKVEHIEKHTTAIVSHLKIVNPTVPDTPNIDPLSSVEIESNHNEGSNDGYRSDSASPAVSTPHAISWGLSSFGATSNRENVTPSSTTVEHANITDTAGSRSPIKRSSPGQNQTVFHQQHSFYKLKAPNTIKTLANSSLSASPAKRAKGNYSLKNGPNSSISSLPISNSIFSPASYDNVSLGLEINNSPDHPEPEISISSSDSDPDYTK